MSSDLIGALSLMTHSNIHREWSPRAVLNWIIAPMMLKQYVLLRDAGKAVGFATWAFVDDEAQVVLRGNTRPLKLSEWNGGEHIWAVDFLAPFGHAQVLARLLRTLAIDAGLADHPVHHIRRHVLPPTEG